MDAEAQVIIKGLETDLQNGIDHMDIDRSVHNPEFDTVKFKGTMANLGKILSADTTKLTLACKPPCKTTDMAAMVKGMQGTLRRITGFVDSIPLDAGKTYIEHIQKLVKYAFIEIISLCKSVAEAKDADKIDQILQSTGSVWEACKQFETHTAKDNREAVNRIWQTQTELIADAQEELKEFIDEQNEDSGDNDDDEDEDDGWGDIMSNGTKMTPVQLETCKKCQQAIKMTTMVFKKIQLRCIKVKPSSDDMEANAWLDKICKSGQLVSDRVDELASSFYEEDDDLKTYIESFVASALGLIDLVEAQVKEEEHIKWFQMCRKQYELLQIKTL
ncbi:hypothetical protein INT43_004131 [Umbelopsis isabellina]|uniref:Uncharacterized protein n=1 Tax=Mortierella isabellina TaxID=91625 RepID=A0A8H7U7H6_MORIS|nr:hypothetical protein INT43_004131 [Umbelopsis isabellina]